MNKAKKKAYKPAAMKRLVRESLVLSATRFLSSRILRFFETGFLSPLLKSVNKVDDFVKDKVTGPIFGKIGIRKNVSMPVRNAVSSFFSNNAVIKWIVSFRSALLNTSLRSLGIFSFTFGIYAAAIVLLKRFVSLSAGEANPADISIAAISFMVGLLLIAFGEKSILSALGNGRITGSILSNCLGVNDSSLDRAPSSSFGTAVGISFLLGSLFGVLTLFFAPARLLLLIFFILSIITILNIPEFGLLLCVSTVSFASVEYLAIIAFSTIVSYLLKCLRLKRNFRFGTADAVVMLMFIVMFFTCLASDDGLSRGEVYVLLFTALYFPAKNIICSEKLLSQAFNSLSTGLSVGITLYLISKYTQFIGHPHLRDAALLLTRHTLDIDMLIILSAATLPFVFSSFPETKSKSKVFLNLLLVLASAVVANEYIFFVLIFVSLFVFIASAYKAPVGAALGAVIVLPPVFSFASEYITASGNRFGGNYWSGLSGVGGIVASVLYIVALMLIFQRTFAGVVNNKSSRAAMLSGTVSASATVVFACSFIFNAFSDIRIIALIWFIMGLCGSVYKVSSQMQYAES